MSTTLATELATFHRELPRLLSDPANRDKYVLIQGDSVAEVFEGLKEGLEAGLVRFELSPYLVKRITEHEKPLYFSRNVQCHT